MADWRAELAAEIERAEREALAEVDAAVEAETGRLREGIDLERQRLRAVLLERSRVLAEAGERAAARAVELASGVSGRGDDEAHVARLHLAALRAHDRLREAARALADEVRAAEGELSVPIVRAQRSSLQEALPGVRRIVAEAAHRSADAERADLELLDRPPAGGIAPWRRRLAEAVRSARSAASEQADGVVRAVRDEVDRAIDAVRRATERMPERIAQQVDAAVPAALAGAAASPAPIRARPFRRVLALFGATLGLLVVFGLGVLAMAAGAAVGGAVFGALLLSGTFAPPVTGGLLAGLVGTLLAAFVTDLLFGALGDWRAGVADALRGAVLPRSAAEPGPVDLRPVLEVMRLPPLLLVPLGANDRGSVTDPGRFAGGLHTSTLFHGATDEVDPDEPEM